MATRPQPTRERSYLAGASNRLTEPEEAALRARLGKDPTLEDLDASGWALTREDYIKKTWMPPPSDEDWGAEHEASLPPEFRQK